MMVILKIPVIYLCAVVWYAIKAEPEPAGGDETASDADQPSPWKPWQYWRSARPRPRRGGPHGAPDRAYARAARPAAATSTKETKTQ